ncbi:hypothetical protein GS504_01020 [Rhodococcus hoagii]|nr:hypothetical protein [Prescottella equi]NKS71748.1 hypothetical protein [Prescottella equi]
MAADGYIFIDIETSGLAHASEHILEVGLALYSLDLQPVERWCTLIVHDQTPTILKEIDTSSEYDFIRNMHTGNGLLADLSDAVAAGNLPTGLDGYDTTAADIARRWGADKTEPLCGSSLRLDRNFIDLHLPVLADCFSHRSIDVSSDWQLKLKRDPEFVAAAAAKAEPFKVGNHRPLGDIHDSVNMLRVLDGMEPLPYE